MAESACHLGLAGLGHASPPFWIMKRGYPPVAESGWYTAAFRDAAAKLDCPVYWIMTPMQQCWRYLRRPGAPQRIYITISPESAGPLPDGKVSAVVLRGIHQAFGKGRRCGWHGLPEAWARVAMPNGQIMGMKGHMAPSRHGSSIRRRVETLARNIRQALQNISNGLANLVTLLNLPGNWRRRICQPGRFPKTGPAYVPVLQRCIYPVEIKAAQLGPGRNMGPLLFNALPDEQRA